jgi:hypothetical protein
MRKLFWCCTAAGVLAAGAVYTAARYACCPETVLTSSAAAATAATRMLHPLVGLGVAAGRCLRGPAAEETATQSVPDEEAAAPNEPVPAPIVIPDDEPATGATMPPATEVGEYPMSPARDCAHVECHPCVPANADPAADNQWATPTTHAPTCPMVMPYCTDDEAPACKAPAMPRADEEPAEPARAAEPPNCQEDEHYYEHYSGCPYTGYHLPSRRCPVTPIEAEPTKRPGQDECSEEPAPKKHKVHHRGQGAEEEECPKHLDVDTMEYRRSDGGLNEYGHGPF